MNPIYSEVYILTLTVVNTCPTDTLTMYQSSFVDYTYYIGEDTDNFGASAFEYSASRPKDH